MYIMKLCLHHECSQNSSCILCNFVHFEYMSITTYMYIIVAQESISATYILSNSFNTLCSLQYFVYISIIVFTMIEHEEKD